VNKTSHNGNGAGNNPSKMSKKQDKYISLEKGQHPHIRDHVTQTQTGFYKNKALKIDFQDNDEANYLHSKKGQGRNIIYHQTNPDNHGHVLPKSKNGKNRSILNTE
jgi:hypothetical protein